MSQADADGATEISDLDRLIPALYEVSSKVEQDDTEKNLASSLGMVVGSRYTMFILFLISNSYSIY